MSQPAAQAALALGGADWAAAGNGRPAENRADTKTTAAIKVNLSKRFIQPPPKHRTGSS
jgi:hypothetical protein